MFRVLDPSGQISYPARVDSVPTTATEEHHLKLLSIFHYIVGGMTALFACIPLIHLGMGLAMVFLPESFANQPGQAPVPPFLGWIFAAIGGGLFLSGQALAGCLLLNGWFIARRRHHRFVFITACIECMLFPYGTVLGVFTIIIVSRANVAALFGNPA